MSNLADLLEAKIASEQIEAKPQAIKKEIRCLQCREKIEVVERDTYRGDMIGSKLVGGKAVFVIQTVFEGQCLFCNREYEIIMRSEY